MTFTEKPLKVVIIGAGVAGLAVAYGLTRPGLSGRFDIKILEKRSDKFPSPAWLIDRKAMSRYKLPDTPCTSTLFSLDDQDRLFAARQSIPARHDGITFLNSRSKRIYSVIREPLESSLLERSDLMDILRNGVLRTGAEIEYERKVISVYTSNKGAIVETEDGATLHADLVIGADGMYSPVRKALHTQDVFARMPWVTCNFRLPPSTLTLLNDPSGINVMYGRGWSLAAMPSNDGVYIALTLPDPDDNRDIKVAFERARLPDSPIVRAVRAHLKIGRAFPLYSAKSTKVGRGRIVLIGDAAHGMNPFCGAGASMALSDGAGLVQILRDGQDLDKELQLYNKTLQKTADPMIKLSRILLWLAQGESRLDRCIRGLAFRFAELPQIVLRPRMQRKLQKVIDSSD